MNIKGLYKTLSLLLIVVLGLPILPAMTIKAADVSNIESDVQVASQAAITAMVIEDTNTTLNIMDGPITITNQSYVQKTNSGTVVSEGTINGELVLIGNQSMTTNITINGSNIPTIRFKNVYANCVITGTASGILNIILDGKCTFQNGLISTIPNITAVNFTGSDGNDVKFNSTGLNLNTGSSRTELNISGLNATIPAGSNLGVFSNCGFSIIDCNFMGDGILIVQNSGNYLKVSDIVKLQNSIINKIDVTVSVGTEFDGVTINSGGMRLLNATYKSENTVIKNSNIKLSGLTANSNTVRIINSRLESGTSQSYPFDFANNVYIKGSTLITTNGLQKDVGTRSDLAVTLIDNSLIFKGTFAATPTNRFYNQSNSTKFNPLDDMGNRLYLNMVKVPEASNSVVSVSIDERAAVNLGTDSDGYLYLYLPIGEHTVNVSDINGINYSKTFTGIGNQEIGPTSNIAGELEPSRDATVILTPYFNSAIQYSFNNTNWNHAMTDASGYFSVIIPDNTTRIYIKLVSTGEVKHAIISHGGVGEFYNDSPIIIEQSNPELSFIKGLPGTMYVSAVPYTTGDTLTYKWYKNGEMLTGKTSPVLNLPIAQTSDAGTYFCIITESDGRTVASISITVTINESQPEEGELKIISQSSAKTLIKGYSTELYVNAKASLSTRELTYQWYKDEEALPGVTDTKLVLSNAKLEDSGSYLCRVYEGGVYIDSAPIPVTVVNNPLEGDVTDLNNLVAALTSQVETLTNQLNSANQDKETLQNTINTLEGQIITYKNQITELQERIEELEQELEEAQGENTTLKQTIINLNNQITSLNQQIIDLQADLETANNEKAALELIVTDLYNDISNLNLQITILEGKLADSEAENAELINQVAALHNTITGLETEITNLRNDIDSLTEQNNQLRNQVESLVSQKTALENEIQRLLGLLDDAYETIDDLTKQVNELTNEVNTLTEQLNTANGEKTALQGTITDLEGQITNLNNQINILNNRVSELEAALQQEGADKETLNQTLLI